jgi:hypothetical protein
MSIKQPTELIRMVVRMHPELLAAVDEQAAKAHLSRASFVRLMLARIVEVER